MQEKAIYELKCLDLHTVSQKSALDRWFYDLIQKKIDDLTDFDVSRMLRQDIYLDIAIPQALKRLENDPFLGPMYDGQMLKNLVETLKKHPVEMAKYVSDAKKICPSVEEHLWDSTNEMEEYALLLEKFHTLARVQSDNP